MRKSSPQGWPPKPVAFGSSLGSSLVLVSVPILSLQGEEQLYSVTHESKFSFPDTILQQLLATDPEASVHALVRILVSAA